MARITRKELKSDKFALEVEHTVDFFGEHQKEFIRYGGIALGAALLIVGYFFYARHAHGLREEALSRAIQVAEAPVGLPTPGQNMNFPTQGVKDQVALREFTTLTTRYSGSDESQIAQYYIGAMLADQGKLAEAEKAFKDVAGKGNDKYASLAKLSLAQIYFADGRAALGETTLRDLMAHPTIYVSREQATIMLARFITAAKPAEARKLLDPLRNLQGPVGQEALAAWGDLMPQQ